MRTVSKLIFVFTAICSSLTFSNAQSASPAAALHASQVEIPMRLEGGMPAIEVTVNGQGPFLFGIDTGAQGPLRIDSSLLEKLGLKPSGQIQGGDPSHRNPQTMNLVKLESIVVGGIRFSEVSAASRDYKSGPRPMSIDGILGLALLSDYLLTLDFPAKIIKLERGELPQADGAEILDYKSEGGVPQVVLSVGAAKTDARLDSGNMIGAFVLPTSFVEKLSFASAPIVVGKARSISGEMEIKQVRLKESARLGSHEFAEPTITFPALGEIGNIGARILTQFVVTFDQQHQRVRLKSATTPKAK